MLHVKNSQVIKGISLLVVCIFLWNQIAWAGGFEAIPADLNQDRSGFMTGDMLDSAQASVANMVAMKQDVLMSSADDGVQYDYDSQGRIITKKYSDGSRVYCQYLGDSRNVWQEVYYEPGWVWQRTAQYYEDGVTLKYEWLPDANPGVDGDIYERKYDEEGRLIKEVFDNGDYVYTNYWDGTANIYRKYYYKSDGSWSKSIEYYEDGVTLKHEWWCDDNPGVEGDLIERKYDIQGRITKDVYDTGVFVYYQYFGDSRNVWQEVYYESGWVWQRTAQYYENGVTLKYEWLPDPNPGIDGDIYERKYDEEGRLIKEVFDNGDYVYTNYWDGTANIYRKYYYKSDGSWSKSIEYYEDGVTLKHEWWCDDNPGVEGDLIERKYDVQGRITKNVYDMGLFVYYQYLGDSQYVWQEVYYETGWVWRNTIQYYADSNARKREWINDPNPGEDGDVIQRDYDASGRLIKEHLDTGEVRDVDSFSREIVWGDNSLQIDRVIYDDNGNMIREVDPDKDYYTEFYYSEGELIRYDKCFFDGRLDVYLPGELPEDASDDILTFSYDAVSGRYTDYTDTCEAGTDDNTITVTTVSGDLITYCGEQIIAIETVDGTVVQNIMLDSDGSLMNGVIKYQDGTVDLVYKGEIIQRIIPDQTVVRYRDSGKTVEYSSHTGIAMYFYIKDTGGDILFMVTADEGVACVYDAEGRPILFDRSNGEISEFEDGRLKCLKIGNIEYMYADDGQSAGPGEDQTYELSRLKYSNGLIVEFDEGMDLNDTIPLQITYSSESGYNYVLMSDGTVIEGTDNISFSDDSSGDSLLFGLNSLVFERDNIQRVYDAEGNLVNVVTDQDTSVTFDENGNVVSVENSEGIRYLFEDKVLTNLTNEEGAEFEFYPDGKVATATYLDGRVYSYTYETSPDGVEQVYVYDNSMQTTRLYEKDLLIWQKNDRGVISEYTYDTVDPDKLCEVTQKKNGKVLNSFVYGEELDATTVTDLEGNVRTYDSEGKLISLFDIRGNLFRYHHTEEGTLIAELSELHKEDGRIIHYRNGAVDYVECPNGTVITNIGFDRDGKLERFTVILTGGETRTCFVDGEWTEIVTDDGTKLIYRNNILIAVNTKGRLLRFQPDEWPDTIETEENYNKIEFDTVCSGNGWQKQAHPSSLGVSDISYDSETDLLTIDADIDGSVSSHKQGEIFLDLQYNAGNVSGPLSLKDQEISFLIKLPEGALADGNPLIVQVFAKDNEWRSQYGTEVTITKDGSWYKVSLSPSETNPPWGITDDGFDPDNVRLIGIRIKTPYDNASVYDGSILVQDGNNFNLEEGETYIDTPFLVDKKSVEPYIGVIPDEQSNPGNPNYISWDAIRTFNDSGDGQDNGILDLEIGSWRAQDVYHTMGIRSADRDSANNQWLVDTRLKSGDVAYNDGEMFVDVRYDIPNYTYTGPLNLTGKELTFKVKIPEELLSSEGEACWAQVFVKDEEYDFQYGTSVYLHQADEWYTVTLIPQNGYIYNGETAPDFDPSRIVNIGVKISCGKNSDIDFEGQILVSCETPPEILNENSPKLLVDVNGLKQHAIEEAIVLTFEEELGPEIELAKTHVPGYFKDDSWAMVTEYYQNGSIKSVLKGSARIENYDTDGKLLNICDKDTNLLINYTYNEDGEMIDIDYAKMRNDLADSIEKVRKETNDKIVEALKSLADEKQLATEQIDAEINSARNCYHSQTAELQRQWHELNNKDVWFWEKKWKSRTLDEIGRALGEVARQLAELNAQAMEAYAQLDSEVESLRDDLVQQGEEALAEIDAEERKLYEEIIEQEVTGLVLTAYRTVLGRDPDEEEVDHYLAQTDVENQKLDGQALLYELYNSEELTEKTARNAYIKEELLSALQEYLGLTGEAKSNFLSGLGLTENDIAPLDETELAYIEEYLRAQSSHFGECAIMSLQMFLEAYGAEGLDYEQLAITAILIDILIGVLDATTGGDLQLSMFAMGKTAEKEGIDAYNLKDLGIDDLELLLESGPVICHIGGNHYVVVQRIEDSMVYYTETAKGSGGTEESVSIDDFNASWGGSAISHEEPQNQDKVMDSAEAMEARGSFLGWLVVFISALIFSITTTVVAIVTVIVNVIAGLVSDGYS